LVTCKGIYRVILEAIKELAARIINNNNNNKDKVTLVSTITFKNVPIVEENIIIDEEVICYILP
jgi:hypothetical protein